MPQWCFALSIMTVVLLMGCSSSGETEDSETAPPTTPTTKPTPGMEFETTTDTVALEKSQLESIRAPHTRDPEVRYMVQIGAFKDPQYASVVQSAARDRYHIPAVNDYNTALALYQIRMGFFETREAAVAFKQRIQRDYPKDYKDAWVVQLKR